MNADKNREDFADDLLVKYLLEEAGAAERTDAEQWINASPAHKKYFEQLRRIWQMSGVATAAAPPAEEAWDRFYQRTHPGQERRPARRLPVKKWGAVAAVLFVVLSGSWMWYRHHYAPAGLLTLSSGNMPLTDTLTDKTVITLNKNSALSYPAHFNRKNRIVQLRGEAFFKVAQQQNHPFIVHINDITVTVLGTSFNINEVQDAVEVIVKTGSVKVSSRNNAVQLQGGEKVVISHNQDRLQKEPVSDELYNYYRTREFICNNTPLRELVAALNKAYDTHIVIANPRLEDLRITTTFHRSQSVYAILAIISRTFNQVTYSEENNRIVLQ